MRRYHKYSDYDIDSDGLGKGCALVIGIVLFALFLWWSTVNQQSSINQQRDEHNMIVIEEPYLYNQTNHLVYEETQIRGGRYGNIISCVYTQYLAEDAEPVEYRNGNFYIVSTGEEIYLLEDESE